MTVTTAHRQPSSIRKPRSHPARHHPAIDHRPESPRGAVSVADLMRPAHVAEPDAPLLEIVYRMLSLGQREIVVVSGHRPLGIITLADLAVLADPGGGISGRSDAGDLLRSRTSRLLPDQNLATAASTMSLDDAEALPVVDYAGNLVGVLASRDVIAHVGRAASDRWIPPQRDDDDDYGPDSFPASDPPSTWAGP